MLENEWKATRNGTRMEDFPKTNESFQAQIIPGPNFAANESISAYENLPFRKEQFDLPYKIMGKSDVTPLLVLLHNQVHSIKLLQPLLHLILTLGSLIQELMIM